MFLRPTWLCIPGCLALGGWSHHCDYLGRVDHFCIVLLCILTTSSSASVRSIPFLSFIVYIFAWNVPLVSLIFLTRSLWSHCEVAQSSPTLCDPMNCSLPGSSVHGIFQLRVLEWVAISFSRGNSWPRDQTQVSLIVGRCFTVWATREAPPSILFHCNDLFQIPYCNVRNPWMSAESWHWYV